MTATTADSAGIDAVRYGMDLTREGRYEEALPLFDAHLPTLSSNDTSHRRTLVDAFSSYGLCVAKVRRKYGQAVQYCEISIRNNPIEPDHLYRLGIVYLERGDRRSAVRSFDRGLRLNPKHRGINTVYERIGRRRRPPIPFLPRDNPLNVWLGKRRRGEG